MFSNSERTSGAARRCVLAAAILTPLLCLSTSLHAQPASQAKPPVPSERRAEAARFFKEGVKLYAAGDYEAACAEFAASTSALATKSGLFNLANCEYEIGRRIASMKAVERLLTDFGALLTPEMSSDADGLRDKLAKELAQIEVSVVPMGAEVFIDGEPHVDTSWFIPGAHQLRVVADGFEEHVEAVEMDAGKPKVVNVVMKPASVAVPAESVLVPPLRPGSSVTASEPSVWMRTDVLIGGVATLAFTGTALGFYLHAVAIDEDARADFANIDDESPGASDEYARIESEEARRDNAATVAIVAGGLAAAALATTGYFVWSASSESADSAAVRLSVTPGKLSLSGRF